MTSSFGKNMPFRYPICQFFSTLRKKSLIAKIAINYFAVFFHN